MKTYVYVDAFNLYFGSLKHTPYKWLDISRLCALLLPKHQIDRIKYFQFPDTMPGKKGIITKPEGW